MAKQIKFQYQVKDFFENYYDVTRTTLWLLRVTPTTLERCHQLNHICRTKKLLDYWNVFFNLHL